MSFTKHTKNGIIYYTSPLFDKEEIPHFFASKHGGVSKKAFFSLNISTSRKDECGKPDLLENVKENLSRGLALIGASENNACMMKQIHSAKVEPASASCKEAFGGKNGFQPCDGIFAYKGISVDTLCVKTADCVPILLYDTKNDVAAALHAGWRGTVTNICGNAVEKMKELHGNAKIIAAIGPSILDCCYEVNNVVYDAARETAEKLGADMQKLEKCFPRKYFADGEDKFRVSLTALNRLFLENAGVSPEDIDEAGLCTCCHRDDGKEIFFSHRASGGFSGTQMSVVKIR